MHAAGVAEGRPGINSRSSCAGHEPDQQLNLHLLFLPCLQAVRLLSCSGHVLTSVRLSCCSVADGTIGGEIPQALKDEAAAVADELQQGMAAGMAAGAEESLGALFGMVATIERAAGVIDQCRALPEHALAAQVVLARAAAGRSCAYLSCSNLQAEGGPAAGQGVGSMRCR